MKAYQIAEIIEKISPKEIAQEWDNVGLLIGDKNRDVNKVLVALDINSCILEQAICNNVDLIVTHHPMIFKPVKKIDNSLLLSLIENKIAVYTAHTNLDFSDTGVNSRLAELLMLKNVYRDDMLAIGESEELSAFDFIASVKDKLGAGAVRASNYEMDKRIKKVAVLGGSGGDFIEKVIENNCDAFVTGEASYHDAQIAFENDLLLISAGHFETENPVVDLLVEYLKNNSTAEIIKAEPFNVYISI